MAITLAALGLATYIIATKYNGKAYLIEKLRQRNMEKRLDKRCAVIRKKVELMWKTSPAIVHSEVTYHFLR
jgi:hypothetical protein